jgi:hypothetical protein
MEPAGEGAAKGERSLQPTKRQVWTVSRCQERRSLGEPLLPSREQKAIGQTRNGRVQATDDLRTLSSSHVQLSNA